ncbi:hypothetical protein FRC10_011740 [Ceratobasidium sp. 414]|nr:hypothetical protein FRC10_011740 [Ceratobasidium sp. 414]
MLEPYTDTKTDNDAQPSSPSSEDEMADEDDEGRGKARNEMAPILVWETAPIRASQPAYADESLSTDMGVYPVGVLPAP